MLFVVVTAVSGAIREARGWISHISDPLRLPDLDMNTRWLKAVELLGAGLLAASPLVTAQSDCPDFTTYASVSMKFTLSKQFMTFLLYLRPY